MANDDCRSHNAQLTRKLDSKFPLFPKPWFMLDISPVVTPLRLAESDAELIAIKAMVENAIAFLYPSDSSTTAQATQMLDSLSNRS
jgi:hypothetical protein